jgi:cellulose synthase/poly-beta-1,6-N-acetylglucosamine synthase-like glycosyltransferase
LFRWGFAFAFLGVHCVLLAALARERLRDKAAARGREDAAALPLVSVIVPFRDEERRIGGLLESLASQDYPAAEFIFVDDCSRDAGPGIVARFAQGRRAFRVITLSENPGPNCKQYALGRGIEAASGEYLLFTDADCHVPPGWIRAMAARMRGNGAADGRRAAVGACLGPVFKRPGGAGFFHLYQCFDHAARYLYLAASTGLGAAGGGFGNNLILSRRALEAAGGYEAVPPSPTEDAALVARIRSRARCRVRAALGADAAVFTCAEPSWKALVNQTLRWNNGGLFSPDLSTRLGFGYLMLATTAGMLALPLVPFVPSLWPLPASVILSMLLSTLAVFALFGASLPRMGLAALLQPVATPAYFALLTLLGLFGVKPRWKDTRV